MVITSCSSYGRIGAGQPAEFVAAVDGAAGAGTFAWIDVADPVPEDFERVAAEFALHDLAIEDAVEAGQRPKVDRYGHTLVAVFRPGRRDDSGAIVYDELFVAIGDQFVLTVSHGPLEGLLGRAKRRMCEATKIPNRPDAALYAIADVVVDQYVDLLDVDEQAIEAAEAAVFTDRPPEKVGQDLFRLKRDVLRLRQAAEPLVTPIEELVVQRRGPVGEEVRHHLRDVSDHLQSVVGRLEVHRELLTDAFAMNVARCAGAGR